MCILIFIKVIFSNQTEFSVFGLNCLIMASSSPTPRELLLLAMAEGHEFEKELLKIISILSIIECIMTYKSISPSQDYFK